MCIKTRSIPKDHSDISLIRLYKERNLLDDFSTCSSTLPSILTSDVKPSQPCNFCTPDRVYYNAPFDLFPSHLS